MQEFLEGIQTPEKKLNITELREREAMWRALWSWTDETVKRYLLRAGTEIRIVQRNYQGKMGELGTVKFEPKEIEVSLTEKTYNYNDGKYYYEEKVVVYPFSSIAWVEGIIDSHEVAEVEPSLEDAIEEDSFV